MVMKNKFLALFVLAIFAFTVSTLAAGAAYSYGAGLEFKTATYTVKRIKIDYPQISGGDREKTAKINKLIKSDVKNVVGNFDCDDKNLDIESEYTIEYNGSNALSVKYAALAYVKGAAHPVSLIHATNINIQDAKPLGLSDTVVIDEELAAKFIAGKYLARGKDLDLESQGALKDIIAGFDKKGLVDEFKSGSSKFYFTKDMLVVSAGVPHAAGDYIEFGISYNDLGKSLLFKPAGFQDAGTGNAAAKKRRGDAKVEVKKEEPKKAETKKEEPGKEEVRKDEAKSSEPDKTELGVTRKTPPAMELIEALCFSQTLHYDSFKSEPDATTVTLMLHRLVCHENFRWKDKLKVENDAYYFNEGPESENKKDSGATYVSPDELYSDYFVNGKFKYAPADISFLISGTQTGVAVHLSDPPYAPEVEVKDFVEKDGKLVVDVKISRATFDEEKPVPIGDAVITLVKSEKPCFFKYRIASFEAKYKKIEEIKLR